MSWAIGGPDDAGRFYGYGVPATCDYPECGASIDRGLSYACGGGVVSDVDNCGRFFCGKHPQHFVEDDTGGGEWVCERCVTDEPPFEPTPDVPEWVAHMLTDESWQQWRDENPERVAAMRAIRAEPSEEQEESA